MTEKEQKENLTAAVLDYYDQHKRRLPWRDTARPYYIWLSEIMLQQTRVEAVKGYFQRFIDELPDIGALANCEEERLLKLWEGLGYYSRARNLKKAAIQLMTEYEGRLPAEKEELRKLAGVGEYTAAAIAAIAFGQAEVALDGNLIRVFSRIFAMEEDFSRQAAKKELTSRIQAYLPKKRPGDFNQAIMDIGATICLPNGKPLCGQCPVAEFCAAYAADEVMRYPLKKEKKSRRTEKKTVLIVQLREKVMLRKRTEQGVLRGLWEFPALLGHCSQEEVREKLAEDFSLLLAITAKIEDFLPSKHIFSHLEWDMISYRVILDESLLPETAVAGADPISLAAAGEIGEKAGAYLEGKQEAVRAESEQLIWADRRTIRSRLSLPSAFKLYRQEILKKLEQEER